MPTQQMVMYELLEAIEKQGLLYRLAANGIISTCVISHKEIFARYQDEIKKGHKKYEAILVICVEYNISRSLAYSIISKMNTPIDST